MAEHKTEVLIIGGGTLGTAIARELSRYNVDITLVEKEVDFGQGISKTSFNTVCQGNDASDFRKEYFRTKLLRESIPMWEPLCRELDESFQRVGQLLLYSNNERLAHYRRTIRRAKDVGITVHQWIDRDTLRSMEPNLSKEFVGALYDPEIAIIDTVRVTIALAENARQNGVHMLLNTEVLDISRKVDGFEVETNNGSIESQFIVNVAGINVDKLAAKVNAYNFPLFPVKAYVAVLDKKVGNLINHQIAGLPLRLGDLNIVSPSVHGNLFIGVPLVLAKRSDLSTTRDLAQMALKNTQSLVPAISERDIINSFVGYILFRNFEIGWHECVVGVSNRVPCFINVSIGFPGVSAAPGTAKEAVRLLQAEGLKLEENPNFNPYRKAIVDFSELSDEEKSRLIAQDPRYGHVVCRCETVTEGEIVEAIRRGATTLDGVKFRCRPGMGRCQGGFCGPRVTEILARELNIPVEQVTKKGGKSQQVLFKSKELIGRR